VLVKFPNHPLAALSLPVLHKFTILFSLAVSLLPLSLIVSEIPG
jgi:hypothetical protein